MKEPIRTFERLFAPSTLAAPSYLEKVDYSVFKQNQQQKDYKKAVKKEHKKENKGKMVILTKFQI